MNKIILLLLIFFVKSNALFSQTIFAKQIGGNVSFCFGVDQDTTYSIVQLNAQFIQFDKFGSLLPFTNVNNINNVGWGFRSFSMIKTFDSCFVVSGYVDSLGQIGRPFIAKTNSRGEMQWLKYSNDIINNYGFNTIQVFDGGLISSTLIYDWLTNRNKVYFQKVDSNGNLIWAEILETQHDYQVVGMCPSESNGFIVTGQKDSQTFFAKFDSSGAVLWCKTIAPNFSFGRQILKLSDGNFLILGLFISSGMPKFFLTKIDTMGNLIWCRAYLKPGRTYAHKVIERQSHELIVVGGEEDYRYGFLLNTDSIGIPTFAKQYSTDLVTPATYFSDVFESNDKSLTLFGDGSFQSMYSANILFKVDSMGDGVCNTLPDTFLYINPNYVSTSDTFSIAPILASLSSFSFTSASFTSYSGDFCINNNVSNEQGNKIAVFPNPVIDKFTISLSDNFTPTKLEIYNSLGQKVLFKEINEPQDREINILVSLPQDIYYGRLLSVQKVVAFSFVVVQ